MRRLAGCWLLAEATERHRGVDGLADLARTPGPRRAEAYRDWMDALAGAGRADDAAQAAREALRTLDTHGSVQAGLADRLAALAVARDDGAALLDARRDAWRADPTLRRLLGRRTGSSGSTADIPARWSCRSC